MRLAGLLALLGLLAVMASGCSDSEPASAGEIAQRKVKVTTTTNFITDTVRQIGGDRVEVTGLMGPGVDPHLYKATAGDVRTLGGADVIFYGGLELEGKMADLLDKLAARQPTQAVTAGIPEADLLDPPEGAPESEQHDPHVWFDVTNWLHVSDTVAERLAEVDPAHADVYRANRDAYVRRLRALDTEVAERMQRIPRAQRVLVTSHDAFHYFGNRYDVDVAAIQGISTAAEATTADIERVAALLARRNVRSVFIESSVPKQTIEAVLAATRERGHDAQIGGELFTDAAGDEGTPEGTYIGMVRHNAQAIEEGLR
ncbi:zinc ABC transporter substrate-binding protein [Svornostia abyssi]|uniref:Zinc ABC transporter substrate-binding protein n=1 Tax=Svornostia abyssi TaxID=2898438 RepID=A0ABY5PBJ2_9ACTN|nr:zinc ABC transporter substrate-binding protein [Parviterribacteraceae bacterium J379]